MKKHALSKWLLAGSALSMVLICNACQRQPKAAPAQPPEQFNQTQPACQPPPTPGEKGCETECSGDECDYEEAGEEGAMIQVIEIEPAETPSATSEQEAAPMSTYEAEKEAKLELPVPAEAASPANVEASAPAVDAATESSSNTSFLESIAPTNAVLDAPGVI